MSEDGAYLADIRGTFAFMLCSPSSTRTETCEYHTSLFSDEHDYGAHIEGVDRPVGTPLWPFRGSQDPHNHRWSKREPMHYRTNWYPES